MSQNPIPYLHHLVHNHPFLTAFDVSMRLYPEGQQASNYRKLCRQLNVDDGGANFPLHDLPKLVNILNEGLPTATRAERGGDALMHMLCRECGLVAYRPKVGLPERRPGDYGTAFKRLGETIAVLATTLTTSGASVASANTNMVDHLYQAAVAMAELAGRAGEAVQ